MRRLLAGFAVLVVLSVAAGLPAVAQQTAKEQDIRKLIDMTGATRIADQIMAGMKPQMQEALRKAKPAIAQEHLDQLTDVFAATFREAVPGLISSLVPVYADTFSHEEIRDILAFYRTPTGLKMLDTLPVLTQRSIQLAQQWAPQVAQQAMQRVQRRMQELGL